MIMDMSEFVSLGFDRHDFQRIQGIQVRDLSVVRRSHTINSWWTVVVIGICETKQYRKRNGPKQQRTEFDLGQFETEDQANMAATALMLASR